MAERSFAVATWAFYGREVLRRMRCVWGGNYVDRSSGRVACGGAGRPAVKPGKETGWRSCDVVTAASPKCGPAGPK